MRHSILVALTLLFPACSGAGGPGSTGDDDGSTSGGSSGDAPTTGAASTTIDLSKFEGAAVSTETLTFYGVTNIHTSDVDIINNDPTFVPPIEPPSPVEDPPMV